MAEDPLLTYLLDEVKRNEVTSHQLAARVNQGSVELERMRGALEKFHVDHARLLKAVEERRAALAEEKP